MSATGTAEELQALLDTSVDGVIVIDATGRIERFNRAAERLFGFSESEALGRNVAMLMPAPERSQHDAYIARYLQTGIPHIIGIGREVSASRRDGSVFTIELSIGRIPGGDPPRFVGIAHDVTLRREALAAVQRERERSRQNQERMTHVARLAVMGEMAAGIAHELNQPLAAIANYAQASERLLKAPTPELAEVGDALGQIAAQALRAGEIIRRLRSLVRRQQTERKRTAVNAVIEELGALTATDARLHEVQLSFHPAAGLPEVWIDSVQIQQVLLNLVRNAIEAVQMRPASERSVIIRTGRGDDGGVQISVEDSGPGVTAEALVRLFDPFFTTKPQGTGLGLAISRSIVTAHRGTLRYAPRRPQGARFVLELPTGEGDQTEQMP